MKKTTSFLLFIVVAVGMLAACQPTAEAPVVDNSARIAELEAELETLREASGDEADARIAELEAELAEAQAVVPEAPEEEEEAPLEFAFVVFLAGSEGWNLVRAGMEDAIAAFDLNVDLGVAQGPTDWDAVQQLTILQQVIATEPDAILITAADSETIVPGVEKAVEQGIVVQSFDLQPATDLADYVGTDFTEMGRVAGERIVELCQEDIETQGKCEVGVTEVAGSLPSALRDAGLWGVLDEYPEIEIVAQVDDGGVAERSLEAATQILAANPDVRVLLCQHGQGALAFATAIKNAGLVPNEDVYVIGNDTGSTTLECIQNGECDSTIGQDFYTMGYYAILNAYTAVEGGMENGVFPGKDGVPWINPGTGLVTADTIDELLVNVEAVQDRYR